MPKRKLTPKGFTLSIDCGNAAFDGDDAPHEVARILRAAADKVIAEGRPLYGATKVFDYNGNSVGAFEFTFD